MAEFLYIDFETRSAQDLRKVGLHNYARHRTTDVWCMAYTLDDGEVHLWGQDPNQPHPNDWPRLWMHVEDGGAVVAHNAAFELAIWNSIMVPRYGWPELKPEQVYCTMAQAYAMGLPGNLEDAAVAMGLEARKDAKGRALMLRMSRPRKVYPSGKYAWWDQPEKLAELYAYCQQDVRVERELHKRLMPLSEKERRVWLLDYKINQKGVAIDRPSVESAVKMVETLKGSYDVEMGEATGGAAESCNALIAIKEWLSARGLPEADDGLAKADLAVYLAREDLSPEVKRVLTLRQEAAKASTAKLAPMLAIAGEDNRLRNLFQYHGAATGRWAGRKVQPHNLPRDVPKPEEVERVLEWVRAGDHDAIEKAYGSPTKVISRCLRSFFVPEKGRMLVGGDYSAIEGRGAAWLAGEEWKLKAFRDYDAGTGPGIYELTASKILNRPVKDIDSVQRQAYGKVPELALGYQGGVGAFQTMARNFGVAISDAVADEIKIVWRLEHPRIKATWYELQNAAISAVRKPGEIFSAGHVSRPAKFRKVGSFLWCLLPSGRALCYPYPKLLPGSYGEQLTYMTVPSPDDRKKGKVISDPANSPKWARVGTYGGSLLENINQGLCRDLLAEAMLRLDQVGFNVVLHVHDEIVCEEVGDCSEGMEALMTELPDWAKDFPLSVKCEAVTRYGQ